MSFVDTQTSPEIQNSVTGCVANKPHPLPHPLIFFVFSKGIRDQRINKVTKQDLKCSYFF